MSDVPGARLSQDKRALLARELAKRRLRAGAAAIPARPAGAPPTLSLAQQRLRFLDRVDPGRATYNGTLTMRLAGPLDADALHSALDTVVSRHEALRTVSAGVGDPSQGRLVDGGVRWRQVDVTEAELPDLLHADAREPFDLDADVLLRATLYRLEPELHVLIIVLHHIASDGSSRGPLFAEITELYNAQKEGRPPRLQPLAIQYGDYALWQHERIAAGQLARDDDFWRQELAGVDFVLDLPTDLPRPVKPDFQGERVAMDGVSGSGDAFRELARSESATFFMAMMAATGAFLHCLTAQEDILVGSPVANRQRPELEPLIGFFVNTLVFRIRLGGNPTFRELIRRCRETAIAAYAHQDMPFDRLVELLNPKRAPGRNPLFQVNYRMQGIAPPPPRLRDLEVTRLFTDTGASRFDLAVGLVDQPDAVRGYLEYAFSLFRRSTALAWSGEFLALIALVTRQPDVSLSAIRELVLNELAQRKTEAARRSPTARSIRSRA